MGVAPAAAHIAVKADAAARVARTSRAEWRAGRRDGFHDGIVVSRRDSSDGASGVPIPTQIKQGLARPEGVGRALATYEVPIEGRDEWLAAARRQA